MPAGFAPQSAPDARVLVLGTIPSVASLQKQQYYGNPRNAFWPIVFSLWGEPLPSDYDARVRFLLERRIALWDVLRQCRRDGSGDAAIRQAMANDFAAFAKEHPQIRALIFNSANAAGFYRRLVDPDPFAAAEKHTLPSTSPARAMRFEEKRELWLPLRLAAEE